VPRWCVCARVRTGALALAAHHSSLVSACRSTGDSDTVRSHPFLATLLDYFIEHGEVRSAAAMTAGGSGGAAEGSNLEALRGKYVASASNAPGAGRGSGSAAAAAAMAKMAAASAARERELRAKLEGEIGAFMARCAENADGAGEREYAFSASLNSFERMLVHDIAGAIGVWHESRGDGAERHIVITSRRVAATPSTRAVASGGGGGGGGGGGAASGGIGGGVGGGNGGASRDGSSAGGLAVCSVCGAVKPRSQYSKSQVRGAYLCCVRRAVA
jgi:hypothetical protein